MRKGFVLCILAVLCLCLSSCGGKKENKASVSENKKREASSAGERAQKSSNEGKNGEEKSEIEKEEISTEGWVKEAPFSEGKKFKFPWLNEEVLGERAKSFNKGTETIFGLVKEYYEEDGMETETEEAVSFDSFTEENTGTFSLVSRYLDRNGKLRFRTLVFDLKEKRPLSFEEAAERAGFQKEDIRVKVQGYFETLYASFAKDDDGRRTEIEMADYVKESMRAFQESLSEKPKKGTDRTYFAVREGSLNLYFSVRLADGGERFYIPYYVRKDLYSNVLLNGNERSLLGRVNHQSGNQVFPGSFVEMITHVEKGENIYFVVLKDNVKVKVREVAYEENGNRFKEKKVLKEKVLKKGEIIGVQTVLPEGLPHLELLAEAVVRDEDGEYPIYFKDYFSYNGRFKDPEIEYLDGKESIDD